MKFLILFFMAIFMAFPAAAKETFEYKEFAQIPVQHEGRIKPLDTFARNFLYAFNGHESIAGMNAEAWLAEMLFDPTQALRRPVFRIFRPELLNLPAREMKYYSYAELAPALQAKADVLAGLAVKADKDLSRDQAELLRLQEYGILYGQLLRSFSFLLPLNISVPDTLSKEWKLSPDVPFTVQDYRRFDPKLKLRLARIIREKGGDPAAYNENERSIALFAFEMKVLEQGGENNILFRILPGQWQQDNTEWFSPWALMKTGQGSKRTAAYLNLWKDMARVYLDKDAGGWNDAAKKARMAGDNFTPSYKIRLEYLYNSLHPLTLSLLFYLAAFIFFIFYAAGMAGPWRMSAFSSLAAGGLLNLCAILLRVLILSRPPVGTLYESIIFVAFICAAVSLLLEHIRKDGNGLIAGSLSGLLLLFIAESFAPDDTMKMLVAVLNTNFWLGTHVLCITIGYGWCLIVSILAHVWMARTAFQKEAGMLAAPIKTLALVSLLFTAIGTILGGIWADQSWGRFWGWDPKENGALLIVLWLIWVLHGQISAHLGRLQAMAAYAALSMVVALAWFGVNLLSVGLHSYGFITGVAAGLGAFLLGEGIIIGGLYYRIEKNRAVSA